MNRLESSTTVQQLVDHSFAQAGNVDFVPLEQNGVIIGGIVVVKGERPFELLRSMVPMVKKEGKS